MTSSSSSPSIFSKRKLWMRIGTAAVLAGAALSGAPRASAGWDDFEFGQKLISRGYIEQARKVFERILADDKRPQADKDRARFGMALLGKADAQASGPNPKVLAKDVQSKFDAALASIREFVAKNPNDAKAPDAKGEIGGLALWYVDWAATLARADKADREARGADPAALLKAADEAADTAVESFFGLMETARNREKDKPDDRKRREERQLAEYRWVTALFYKTLPLEPCSAKHISALQEAKTRLDDYATANDGVLTGVYALDNLGRVLQELGQCESDPEKKLALLQGAHQQYVSCAGTPDEGEAYRMLIALGYLHDARLANKLPNLEDVKYVQLAREVERSLSGMIQAAPKAARVHDGVEAQVEHAQLLLTLRDQGRALEVANNASNLASQENYPDVKRRADSILKLIVGGSGSASDSSGGSVVANVDVSVIYKVGESLMRDGKFGEAIGAFQQAIPAAGPSRADFVQWVLPAWLNIGECYRKMTPPLWLESATAYDAIVDYVRAGAIKPSNENDPASKTAFQASSYELAALRELVKVAGDPMIQERVKRFDRESYELFKGYQGGGSVTDRGYAAGIESFNRGIEAKRAADGKGEAWKAPFAESKTFFSDVSKNSKSDYQDKSLKYLVRVPYEMGDHAGVVAAADAAAAWWETPDAKNRLTQPGLEADRKAQASEVRYWKAAALHELQKDEAAMPLLDALVADKSGAFRERAMGLHVEILLEQGKGKEGEEELRRLTKEYPDYYNLPKLLLRVASVYDEANKALQGKVDVLTKQLVGTAEDRATGLDAQRKAADKEAMSLVPTISDQTQRIARLELIVQKSPNEGEKEIAERELQELRPKLAEARERLAKLRAQIADLNKEYDRVGAERLAIQREQAGPLKQSADLYLQLDEALKDLDAKAAPGEKKRRRADPLTALAYRYYYLGKLQPEVASHWVTARALYEDYLALPEIKGLAETDEAKRKVQRFLGEIYNQLAEQAKTPEERQSAASNAVRYLQASLAKNPQNAQLVLGHLAGESMVVSFRDPSTDRRWNIPMRRAPDVASFRQAVKDLGPSNLPRFANDRFQNEFDRAVKQFKDQIDQMSDDQVKSTVAKLKDSGFDPGFFAEHASTNAEFLLDLARSFLRSEVAENAYKALNVATELLSGPGRVEGDSPEWWEAKTIQLEAIVSIAEREAAASPESGVAKQRAKSADDLIRTMKSLYPRIGGVDNATHTRILAAWQALQQRSQKLMTRVGLIPTVIDLAAEPQLQADPDPVPPGMDGAAPADGAMDK